MFVVWALGALHGACGDALPAGCESGAVGGGRTEALGVTVVSQCTEDRLWLLDKFCERWHGPMSVGIQVDGGRAEIFDVEARARERMVLCTERHVSVLVTDSQLGAMYPANRLRNMAWAKARTSHILLLDIDFWPSTGAHQVILRALRRDDARVALIVPAIKVMLLGNRTKNPARHLKASELARQIPTTKTGLTRCLANLVESGAPKLWRPTRANHWEDPISDAKQRRRGGAPAATRRPRAAAVTTTRGGRHLLAAAGTSRKSTVSKEP